MEMILMSTNMLWLWSDYDDMAWSWWATWLQWGPQGQCGQGGKSRRWARGRGSPPPVMILSLQLCFWQCHWQCQTCSYVFQKQWWNCRFCSSPVGWSRAAPSGTQRGKSASSRSALCPPTARPGQHGKMKEEDGKVSLLTNNILCTGHNLNNLVWLGVWARWTKHTGFHSWDHLMFDIILSLINNFIQSVGVKRIPDIDLFFQIFPDNDCLFQIFPDIDCLIQIPTWAISDLLPQLIVRLTGRLTKDKLMKMKIIFLLQVRWWKNLDDYFDAAMRWGWWKWWWQWKHLNPWVVIDSTTNSGCWWSVLFLIWSCDIVLINTVTVFIFIIIVMTSMMMTMMIVYSIFALY